MSEGCLLRALVRGLMKDEFLQSPTLADALRVPGSCRYDGPPGEEAIRAIAGVYDELPDQGAKDTLRSQLLRAGHLRYRLTREGIKNIVEFYLLGSLISHCRPP